MEQCNARPQGYPHEFRPVTDLDGKDTGKKQCSYCGLIK